MLSVFRTEKKRAQPIGQVSSWPTRSGLAITAVTFNLRYLLLNCRPTGAYLLVRQIQIPRCGRACTRRLRR
jgi:hypothetical protein